MEIQQFGSIETAAGDVPAMLCIDSDVPDEFMIHIWGSAERRMAVLAKGISSGKNLELIPQFLFRPGPTGSLVLPNLTSDEQQEMLTTRMSLVSTKTGYKGYWKGNDGKRRAASFSFRAKSKGVEAQKCTSWDQFKAWAEQVRREHDAAIFRGHGSNKFQLKTTLHRAGRSRIERYCDQMLPTFCHHAEAVLGARFDLANGEDFSTVLGLAQHHGLPTPMLDWTGSPYIAAFFAFSDALDSARDPEEHSHVRVFALSREFVEASSPRIVSLPTAQPYVASLAITARHNARLYAQQGRFLVTNVSALELFITELEAQAGQRVLYAADVPVEIANQALEDLAFMGLTAANLFPGLDGVCRMMKHQMSFKRVSLKGAGAAAGSDVPRRLNVPEDEQSQERK